MPSPKSLRARGVEGLEHLLRARPDLQEVNPGDLAELSAAMGSPWSVIAALRGLDVPTLQVCEALAAMGGHLEPPALAQLLGARDEDARAAVSAAVSRLDQLGLLEDDGALAPFAISAWPKPLALGPPLALALEGRTADDLKSIARAIGISHGTRKAEILAAVTAALSDPERVRALAASAPADARKLLTAVALTGEEVHLWTYYSPRNGRETRPEHWCLRRGLLLAALEWNGPLIMPAEVALALRGPDWTAPFAPTPPAPDWQPVSEVLAERECTGSAAEFVRIAADVLDSCGRRPPELLKSGAVGVRELRRLAKELRCAVPDVRLALEVTYRAGLLSAPDSTIMPSAGYDTWLGLQPPERIATLVHAWWTAPGTTLTEPEAAWHPHPDLPHPPASVARVRAASLRALADRPGLAPLGGKDLVPLITWRMPYVFGGASVAESVEASLAEAARLGLVGAHALGAAGAALVDGDEARLLAALAGTGHLEHRVRLQADLTGMVLGNPDARVSALLDSCADREGTGSAMTWRFSPTSIGRALDAGADAGELLAQLTDLSEGEPPQPLAYLVRDVARRHGGIRGQKVACVLRSDDEALVAEVAATRSLRSLGLRRIAPTVLAGAKPLAETLQALRTAGYLPVEETADGVPVLVEARQHRARPARSRSGSSGRSRRSGVDPTPPTARELAERLLAAHSRTDGGRGRSRTTHSDPRKSFLALLPGGLLDDDLDEDDED